MMRLPLARQMALVGLSLVIVPASVYLGALGYEKWLREQLRADFLAQVAKVGTLLPRALPDVFPAAHNVDGLYAYDAPDVITVDGYVQDWRGLTDHMASYGTGSFGFRIVCAHNKADLYALIEVTDPDVVYRDAGNLSVHRNDHVRITLGRAGSEEQVTIAPLAAGPAPAYLVTGTDEGNRAVREDTDIEAFWASTDNGYRVELRLPLSGIGHIVFSVTNVEHNSGGRPVATASTAKPGDAAAGTLIRSSKALSSLLSELAQQDETFEVYDTAQHRLGIGGSGMSDTGYAPQNADTFAAIDGVPRSSSGENQVRASVALTQSGKALGVLSGYQSIRAQMDDLRTWRDMTTVGAAILALVALALAAAWGKLLGSRIERVAKAFDGIIDSRGRIRGSLPATGHLDEVDKLVDTLGDASNRMAQYTDHLENLSVRLTHELRTPLTVIRSSLDNLEPANLPGEASVYVSRAGEGVRQLSSILSNMTEATRLEESLDPAEQEYFDLEEVVRGCVRGYEVAWPNRAFEVVVESKFDKIFGLPELIAQMLDKLVSNANEFGEPGTPIRVLISTGDGDAILRVINEGPSLPDQVSRHLFERMVSVRSRADGATHLGLGLYLARMIATFHGGRIDASNTPDGLGVAVTVRLPLLRMIGRRD